MANLEKGMFRIARDNVPGKGKQKFYLSLLFDDAYWFANKSDATLFTKADAEEEIAKRFAIHGIKDLYKMEQA